MNTPITSKTVGNKIARSISIAPIRLFFIMRRYPIIPMMVIVLLVITAIFGSWMEPHDPIRADVLSRHIPPSWMEGGDPKFILGTDALGRDVLSRIIGGASVTLLVVTASVTTGVVVGTGLGR